MRRHGLGGGQSYSWLHPELCDESKQTTLPAFAAYSHKPWAGVIASIAHCFDAFAEVPWASVTHLGTTAMHLWQMTGPWLEVLLAERTLRNCQSGGCGHRAAGEGGQTPWRGRGGRAWRGSPSGRLPEVWGSREWRWRCQPLQGGGKGKSCKGETEARATRAARAAGEWFMLMAAKRHRQGLHRSLQPGPGSDPDQDRW